MNDWLNKSFAIFTMYKTNREIEDADEGGGEFAETVCLNCGESTRYDQLTESPQFCTFCGTKL